MYVCVWCVCVCVCVCVYVYIYIYMASQVVPAVKNLPANVGDARDTGSIPGSGRSPRVGNGTLLHHYEIYL